jgi:L-alanine-DL-glutamate epimerase-like enolase superfamily enzyme
MKKIKINFKNFYLFSVPVDFDIAPLKILSSHHLLVKLKYQGKEGIGEGVLYKTSPLKTLDLLVKEFEQFFQKEFSSFSQAREGLIQKFFSFPGVICAFDLALWDLEGKIKRKPVFELLGRKKRSEISVAEQIFIPRNRIHLIRGVKKILNHKTNSIKLKAGRVLEDDIENIVLIKEITENKINIQLDLNQGLSFNQAVNFGRKIKNLGISLWEEPIKFKHFNELNKLKRKTKLAVILDESIKNMEDLKQSIKSKAIDILNVKISRLGGLTNSLQLIKLANKNKVEIEIGCSEELGVGTNAQLHLVSYLKKLKTMEVLGAERLDFDIIKEKQRIKNGFLKTPVKKPGLGINFSFRQLNQAGKKKKFSIITKANAELPFLFYLDYFSNKWRSKFFNGLFFLKKSFERLRMTNE